jgi:hypothetical protein
MVDNTVKIEEPTVDATTVAANNGQVNVLSTIVDAFANVANTAAPVIQPFTPTPLKAMFSGAASFMPNAFDATKQFTAQIDTSINEGIQTFALANQSPEGLLNLLASTDDFKTPEGKEIIEIAKGDEAFAKSLHAAVTKDPSVLKGFMSADAEGGEALNLADLRDVLKDDGMRSNVTKILNAVAESPDDNLDNKYLVEVAKAAKAVKASAPKQEDYKKLQMLLAQAGISDVGLNFMVDPMSMVNDFINDPQGFLTNLPAMLGMQGEQAAAFGEILGPIGGLLETVIGGETGYRAFFQHYGPEIQGKVQDMGYRLSGDADKDAAAREAYEPGVSMQEIANNISDADLSMHSVSAQTPVTWQSVVAGAPIVPSIAAASELEGDTNNINANQSLGQSFVFAGSRPFEAGLPKVEAPFNPAIEEYKRQQTAQEVLYGRSGTSFAHNAL